MRKEDLNYRSYLTGISTRDSEYRTTVKDFKSWLTDTGMTATFKNTLKSESLYYTANDFSIPVSMVKYFKAAGI